MCFRILPARKAFTAAGAAGGTLIAIVAYCAAAYTLVAHTAVFAAFVIVLVAFQAGIAAAFAELGTILTFAAYFADFIINTVCAAAAFLAAQGLAGAIHDVIQPAVVAVRAIFIVIVTFQAHIMAAVKPGTAFSVIATDTIFAAVAMGAKFLKITAFIQYAIAALITCQTFVAFQA